jgi:hypothetical protein
MVRQLAGEPAKQTIRVRDGESSCRHGTVLLAKLSLAAINCLARIRLASPVEGVFKIVSSSAWV